MAGVTNYHDVWVLRLNPDGSIAPSCDFIGDTDVSGVDSNATVTVPEYSVGSTEVTPQDTEITAQDTNVSANFICQAPHVIQVTIDIKPGSFPNSINPKSKGKIPVAILSDADFDAPNQVDQGSLTFGLTGDEQSLAFCNTSPKDVNGDGFLDLVCHFYTQLAGFQTGDTEGVLKGHTVEDTPLSGTDSVRIVPK